MWQGRLMAPPNVTWQSIIQQAMVSADVLKQSEVVRNVQNILQTNVSVCSSLGAPFLSQMRIIYVDMLTMYKCALHVIIHCATDPILNFARSPV